MWARLLLWAWWKRHEMKVNHDVFAFVLTFDASGFRLRNELNFRRSFL